MANDKKLITCRGRNCGAKIFFAMTERGKKMPLDAQPSAAGKYILQPPEAPGGTPRVQFMPGHPGDRYVSHYETCADTQQFTQRRPPVAQRKDEGGR